MIMFTKERFEISKGSTKIILALGCGYDPDYTIEHNLKPITGTPYIKFDDHWYPVINASYNFCSYYELANFLQKDNYCEEVFLEKIMRLIYPDES